MPCFYFGKLWQGLCLCLLKVTGLLETKTVVRLFDKRSLWSLGLFSLVRFVLGCITTHLSCQQSFHVSSLNRLQFTQITYSHGDSQTCLLSDCYLCRSWSFSDVLYTNNPEKPLLWLFVKVMSNVLVKLVCSILHKFFSPCCQSSL